MRRTMSSVYFTLLAACVLLCISAGTLLAADNPNAKEPFVGGSATLILDAANCGPLHTVSGGASCANVVNDRSSKGPLSPYGISCEPIAFQIGLGVPNALQGWIADAWNAINKPKNGKVLYCDSSLKALAELQFTGGIVLDVTTPACDRRSTEMGYLSVSIQPTTTMLSPPSPSSASGTPYSGEWHPGQFALQIDGIDCSKVLSIEPFSVKRQVGGSLQSELGRAATPVRIVCSNLKVVISDSSLTSWKDWADHCFAGPPILKNGAIIFFDNALKEINRIKLYDLAVCKLGPAPVAANGDGVGLAAVEVTCARAGFGAASTTEGKSSNTTRPIGR